MGILLLLIACFFFPPLLAVIGVFLLVIIGIGVFEYVATNYYVLATSLLPLIIKIGLPVLALSFGYSRELAGWIGGGLLVLLGVAGSAYLAQDFGFGISSFILPFATLAALPILSLTLIGIATEIDWENPVESIRSMKGRHQNEFENILFLGVWLAGLWLLAVLIYLA